MLALVDPVVLCGEMFELPMYRHRLFEFGNMRRPEAPVHPPHTSLVAPMGRKPKPGEYWSLAGNFSGVKEAGIAMRMPWANQDGLRQAIPACLCPMGGASSHAHFKYDGVSRLSPPSLQC